jgi:hypothetical protein
MNRTKLHLIALAMLALAFGSGCNNNRGRGVNTGANIGVLPTTTCLLTPNSAQTNCNYDYSSTQGFTKYEYNLYIGGLNNEFASGFCGCGQGGFPVYNNNWGLGCVSTANLQQTMMYYSRFLMFNWDSTNKQWLSANSSFYNNYGGFSTCGKTVLLACDTRVQGSCGPNGACASMDPYNSSPGKAGVCLMNNSF